jgi:hypothetical protein
VRSSRDRDRGRQLKLIFMPSPSPSPSLLKTPTHPSSPPRVKLYLPQRPATPLSQHKNKNPSLTDQAVVRLCTVILGEGVQPPKPGCWLLAAPFIGKVDTISPCSTFRSTPGFRAWPRCPSVRVETSQMVRLASLLKDWLIPATWVY